MKLEDIRNNPAIMERLRRDLTKEKIARSKETFNQEDAGFYFCIYVSNGRACLALLHYYPNGTATQDCISGFPEDMILASLKEAGGSTEVNGYYPINHPIEEMLRLGLLYVSGKARVGQSQLTEGGSDEEFIDIQDPALRKLFAETKHASSTIENDADDALNESSNDEELINNWQSKLMDLYNECQYYWGELEKMKSGKRCIGEAVATQEGSQ